METRLHHMTLGKLSPPWPSTSSPARCSWLSPQVPQEVVWGCTGFTLENKTKLYTRTAQYLWIQSGEGGDTAPWAKWETEFMTREGMQFQSRFISHTHTNRSEVSCAIKICTGICLNSLLNLNGEILSINGRKKNTVLHRHREALLSRRPH